MQPRNVMGAVVCLATLLGACGSPSSGPAGSSDDVVSSTPGDDGTSGGGAQRVTPHEGLVDVRTTVWDKVRPVAGGRSLDLYFWSGIEECYGIDRVEVAYGTDRVTVTIHEGREPGAETCIELAVRKVIRVSLEEPLGGREVVDGGARD